MCPKLHKFLFLTLPKFRINLQSTCFPHDSQLVSAGSVWLSDCPAFCRQRDVSPFLPNRIRFNSWMIERTEY